MEKIKLFFWELNKKTLLKALIFISTLFLAIALIIGFMNYSIIHTAGKYTKSLENVPETQVAIVLGAYVNRDGQPCAMLYDRILTGVELYKAGKVKKILMTGDHGRYTYDEVNAMRELAEKFGVPAEDIFMDHAGFSTYESIYRADYIFNIKSAVVVTQDFHLDRALYMARKTGIKAYGIKADRRTYMPHHMEQQKFREFAARCKDYLYINILKPGPTFLGPVINIEGDGRATHDKKKFIELQD